MERPRIAELVDRAGVFAGDDVDWNIVRPEPADSFPVGLGGNLPGGECGGFFLAERLCRVECLEVLSVPLGPDLPRKRERLFSRRAGEFVDLEGDGTGADEVDLAFRVRGDFCVEDGGFVILLSSNSTFST